MKRFALLTICLALLLTGCGGRSAYRATMADAAYLTESTLLELLLGPPEGERPTQTSPSDKPLLKRGLYEKVILTTDRDSFERLSKGSIRQDDLKSIEKTVTEDLTKILEKKQYAIRAVPFPPGDLTTEDKTLLVTLTPSTEEGGSPSERAAGRGATYILIRVTITDTKTGQSLRIRDFYSGRDVNRPLPSPSAWR